MSRVRSLTVSYHALSRSLLSDVSIAVAFDPSTTPQNQHSPFKPYKGIWDTGATASVITQKVVDELNLQPTGMTKVHHAHGNTFAEVYLVNIGLPNGVAFVSLRVTKGELASADVLIGMDIIGQGDFAVTNHNSKTIFSYRIPSVEIIDFTGKVKHPSAPVSLPPVSSSPAVPKVGRNAPCPCGSGKKYKKCCENKQQPVP